jgi:hypothetical protein
MRRWLTLILLFVLPVQFAWSAAAAHCQHEQAPATTHIGHHVHVHNADGDTASKLTAKKLDDSSSGKAGKLVGDNDCGYCQLSMAKSMIPVIKQPALEVTPLIINAPPQAFQSRGSDRIERPQWQLA